MAADDIEVRVAVAEASFDEELLADSAARLGEELGELDVEEVRPAGAGDAPPGAKGVELLALGALVVKLARSRKVLGEIVDAVRDWVSRNDAQSVRLEIDGDVLEITGATARERKQLIDTWVERHTER